MLSVTSPTNSNNQQPDMGADGIRFGGVQVHDLESELCSFLPVSLWRYPPSFFDGQGHTFLFIRLVVYLKLCLWDMD